VKATDRLLAIEEIKKVTAQYFRFIDTNMIGYGHYHERYRKGDDGVWRICSSRVERLHIDELEATAPP
jgi:hypothetical protein